MKIVIIIIIVDILIFTLGAIFADKELKTPDTNSSHFHMDRFGYHWRVEE
ncbi:MAG: hypothetical protein J7K14_04705 [Sulfurimonas sp.]|nr:hypothetical protein [Sulfurimonas sp.]